MVVDGTGLFSALVLQQSSVVDQAMLMDSEPYQNDSPDMREKKRRERFVECFVIGEKLPIDWK
jgi:hypothetical protein